MSKISNRFYVTALEDGTTLHGSLAATQALSQAYNSSTGACIPNWETDVSKRPTIYLNLLVGNTQATPTDYKWYYNGVEITNSNPNFTLGTYDVDIMDSIAPSPVSPKITMPAVTIVKNLASSNNVDLDTITIRGTKEINGSELEFSATCQIKISQITKGSSIGVISFVNGISDITEKGQTITAYGVLYKDDGTPVADATTKWFLNDDTIGVNGADKVVGGVTYHNAYQITEGDVTDYATLRCDFYADGTLKYSAYVGIDDVQDPEFLYIQYNGNNGNAASLRTGQSAAFTMWIGTRDNPTVLTEYAYMRIKLLKGDGTVVGGPSFDDIPAADVNGWRTLTRQSDNKFKITPSYDNIVSLFDKNMTGIIMASDAPFT